MAQPNECRKLIHCDTNYVAIIVFDVVVYKENDNAIKSANTSNFYLPKTQRFGQVLLDP